MMTILIIVLIVIALLIQYLGVIVALIEEDISNKKHLIYWLIPFSYVHYICLDLKKCVHWYYTELVEKYKELD